MQSTNGVRVPEADFWPVSREVQPRLVIEDESVRLSYYSHSEISLE